MEGTGNGRESIVKLLELKTAFVQINRSRISQFFVNFRFVLFLMVLFYSTLSFGYTLGPMSIVPAVAYLPP